MLFVVDDVVSAAVIVGGVAICGGANVVVVGVVFGGCGVCVICYW